MHFGGGPYKPYGEFSLGIRKILNGFLSPRCDFLPMCLYTLENKVGIIPIL